MKRLCALLAMGAFALGCSKKNDDEKKGTKKEEPAAKVQHGKGEGKGTGGGDKTATGTMNAKPGSGKAAGSGSGSGPGDPGGDPVIARGAYLATGLGGCVLCHTPMQDGAMAPDMTKLFAGGGKFPDVFGTWTPPNITPDPETGIGKWSDEDVIKAMRQGVRPDGTVLHPIMPYMGYHAMTDDDAKAIVAFLRNGVKPVVNKVELSTDLKRPPEGLPAPTGNKDDTADPLKHGEYLVTLMHCAMCHSPPKGKGKDLQFDMSKPFAGGFAMEFPPEMGMGTGVLYTPNITSDEETGIGKWTEADVVKALRTLTRPDGRPIMGPMQMYAGAWNQITDEDMAAIAKYVKSIPAIKNKVPASTYKPPEGPPPGAPPGPPPGDKPPPQ
jgi:mono/diheme cytochrome c family protein